jgi:hypothetical protein
MPRKPQFHVSGIELLSTCGIAFEKRYLERIAEPRSVQMVRGSAVDRAVSLNLESKRDNGVLLSVADVRDIARDALVDEWKNGSDIHIDGNSAFKNGEDVVTDEEEDSAVVMDEVIDTVVDMAAHHASEVAPTISPTHVQEKWVLDIPELDVQLAGAIDVREALVRIRDTKTKTTSPVKTLADDSLQLGVYALRSKAEFGQFPREVQLDVLVRTPKRHDLKHVPLVSRRGPEDMPYVIARIEAAVTAVNRGNFLPASLNHWKCSKRYCGYWATCRYARRPVTVQINGLR